MDMEWMTKKASRKGAWETWKSRNSHRRAMLKNGDTKVIRKKLSKISRWRYLQDIFTTLMDAQWRWTFPFIVVEFFGCWIFFALIWFLIAFVHGDLHEDHLPSRQAETGWTPCVLNIHGFHSCFLYSLETQHTTGYGLRVITEECPEAIFIMCFQCIIGMIIDSFTIGIVFAKMVRPKFASQTIQFSKNAALSYQDGKLCFMFRVGDIRRSRMVGVGVRAILIKDERSKEGEVLNNYQRELSLKADGGDSSLFLLWPITIYHEIDEESPLYDLTTPENLRNQKFEIMVILNATVESTGASAEAKSSYVPNEILYGRRFESMVSFNKQLDSFEIDWSKFENTVPVNFEDNIYENIDDSPDSLENPSPRCSVFPGRLEESAQDYFDNDEMIIFENKGYLPYYGKPPVPAWPINKKSDCYERVKSKYYPDNIKESDENQDRTYV